MRRLRPELARVVAALVSESASENVVALDAIGEALGTLAVSQDEIDAILTEIEARGVRVSSPEGGRGEVDLKSVLDAARLLRRELGRAPRPVEVAARSGLSIAEVHHALFLVRIMQR